MTYELTGCARLSLQRVTGRREPAAPTNDVRLRRFRSIAEPPRYNDRDWPHCKRAKYEAEQIADSVPDTFSEA